MSFISNRRVILADVEEQQRELRRKRREAELSRQTTRGNDPQNLSLRESRLAQILEELKPTRSRQPQVITQDLTYITQILGGILLGENPCDNPVERKKIATMYVKLLDIIGHIVTTRGVPKAADSTMSPLDGENRVMPPAQPTTREINSMTPEDLRLWHQHRRDKMRRDASKYPKGHAGGRLR